MNSAKRMVFEVLSNEVKIALTVMNITDPKFRKELNVLLEFGLVYKNINWNNRFSGFIENLTLIRDNIKLILSSGICDLNNSKMIRIWCKELSILLPKIEKAI